MTAGGSTGSIRLRLFDGRREPFRGDVDLFVRVIDGRKQTVVTKWVKGANIPITGLPYYNSPSDWYTIIVHADGYRDGGIYPVKLQKGRLIDAFVMLLPTNGSFHFPPIAKVRAEPLLCSLLENGTAGGKPADVARRYHDTLENHPMELGALFVIGAAIRDIPLATAQNPLGYHWEVIWDLLAADRFWAWVDTRFADDIAKLEELHSFAEEQDADHWHPGLPGRVQPATRSWKQTRFDVTNVQLTFHEKDTKTIRLPDGNVKCVVVEPDIDYYKDLVAHGLAEVLPHFLTHGISDPREDYCLRWMATKLEGIQPDYDPLVTIE